MPRIVHFEISAKDPEKKISFYQDVFGWQFQQSRDGYWMILTGADGQQGINGGLMRSSAEDSSRTINTVSVTDLDEYLGKVEQAGGKITTSVMELPGVGKFAYCDDPDGLAFGVIQF